VTKPLDGAPLEIKYSKEHGNEIRVDSDVFFAATGMKLNTEKFKFICEEETEKTTTSTTPRAPITYKTVTPNLTLNDGRTDYTNNIIVNSGETDNKLRKSVIKGMILTKKNNEVWVYCNFPEQIDNNVLNKYYVNIVEVNGKAQIFYSYGAAKITKDFCIGVQAINDTGKDLTVYIDNIASGDTSSNGHDYVVAESWNDFFNVRPKIKSYIVSSNSWSWIFNKDVKAGSFFSGNIRIRTTAKVTLKVFAYDKNYKSERDNIIEENAEFALALGDTIVDHAGKETTYNELLDLVYSGKGIGYNLYSNISISMEELTRRNVIYETGNAYADTNKNDVHKEFIRITIPESAKLGKEGQNIITIKGEPYSNLGNWCLPYNINVTITNDTNEKHTVKAFIIPSSSKPVVLIKDGEKYKFAYSSLNNGLEAGRELPRKPSDEEGIDFEIELTQKLSMWNWTSVTLNPGEIVKFDYIYILGTDGSSYVMHLWSIDEFNSN
jgi:hypothetical protein